MGVRWDAVVQDKRFWTEPQDAAAAPAGRAQARVLTVELWLFGALVAPGTPRPLRRTLAAPFSVRDVLGELAAHAATKACRVFVDGAAVEDLDAPLQPRAARVEIILLTGIEGG